MIISIKKILLILSFLSGIAAADDGIVLLMFRSNDNKIVKFNLVKNELTKYEGSKFNNIKKADSKILLPHQLNNIKNLISAFPRDEFTLEDKLPEFTGKIDGVLWYLEIGDGKGKQLRLYELDENTKFINLFKYINAL